MPKLTIDGEEIEVKAGLTVLQACELAGKEIPRFCYHERLSVAGNCRMCLVEVSPGPAKPAASCAMPVAEGMEVKTDSEMAVKARQGVMEFLLINHPLDCPICDQGGECDLQDQAIGYGYDRSRYQENKRAVEDKNLGPLIKTIMTRCIHCTRCIRFATEVAGVPELGTTGRGENMEVGTYVEKALTSELSGNMIDLCPVGALTSKPYAFTARSWELRKTESIDVMDALGASIRVDTKGREVMRFLPLNHDGTNEEWISDKTRFVWDGLRRQRLDRPYIRENGKLRPSTWPEALNKAATALKGAVKPAGLVGDLTSVEAAFALKGLIEGQGGIVECRTDGAKLPSGNRAAYVGTASIEDIDGAASITLIGSNPRLEAPVLNARLRKAWTRGANVSLIGEAVDLTYEYSHVGTGTDAITELLGQDHSVVMAQPSLIILGQGALTRGDGAAVLAAAQALAARTQSGLLVLHTAAGRVGAMDVGATNPDAMMGVNAADVIYNLGADEIEIADDAFVIYQGSHGDRGAHRADVILPGAAYTEEPGLFVNTEGRPQLAARASFAPGDAKENWAILRALSGEMGAALPYDSIGTLRDAIVAVHPHLGDIDVVSENAGEALAQDQMEGGTLVSTVTDFYLSNPIARASQLMAELSANAKARNSEAMAAE